MKLNIVFLASVLTLFFGSNLYAAGGSTSGGSESPNGMKAERLSVDAIKEKYWTRGDENELRVVQNRLYSKARKLELGVSYGSSSSDPFLTTSQVGGSLGYFLSEYVGIEFFGWKAMASESDAGTDLRKQTKAQSSTGTEVAPNTNKQQSFLGGQLRISPLYGKLSLVG